MNLFNFIYGHYKEPILVQRAIIDVRGIFFPELAKELSKRFFPGKKIKPNQRLLKEEAILEPFASKRIGRNVFRFYDDETGRMFAGVGFALETVDRIY